MPATQARLEAGARTRDIFGARRRDRFYLLLCLAMTCTVFVGFSFTYFGPIARDAYMPVPPIVHVHGWSVLHDVRRHGSVHQVYRWGVAATLLVVIGMFLLGDTAAGDVLESGLGAVGEAVRPL